MEETGSIGVRILPVRRIIARREIRKQNVEIFGKRFTVRVRYLAPPFLSPNLRTLKESLKGWGFL